MINYRMCPGEECERFNECLNKFTLGMVTRNNSCTIFNL